MAYHVFSVSGFFDMFRLPNTEFHAYFRSLENGYHKDNPCLSLELSTPMSLTCYLAFADHNRIHAADVLHGCHHLVTAQVPGFARCLPGTPTAANGMQR